MSVKVLESKCPHCGRSNDRASQINGPDIVPKPGDFSICIGCAHLVQYDKDLSLKKCSDRELKRLKQKQPADYKALQQAQARLMLEI